jgi:hypothetical protein
VSLIDSIAKEYKDDETQTVYIPMTFELFDRLNKEPAVADHVQTYVEESGTPALRYADSIPADELTPSSKLS